MVQLTAEQLQAAPKWERLAEYLNALPDDEKAKLAALFGVHIGIGRIVEPAERQGVV